MNKGSRRVRRWAGIAIVVLVIIVAVAAWQFLGKGDNAPKVITAAVAMGDVERSVIASGTVKPATIVSVGAQVSGQVTRLEVQLGQTVHKGDLIAEIDSDPQQIELRNAQERLNSTRAQRRAREATLARARLELTRQTELMRGDATSQSTLEAADADVKVGVAEIASLDAQIAQAESSVRTAEVNLAYTQIRAPIDGTVIAIVTKRGQTVNANQTTPTIVKLARLDAMVVQVQISEADVIKVHEGQDAYFSILGEPDRRYQTKLDAIDPAPESIAAEVETRGRSTNGTAEAIYYNGRLDVPNPDGRLRTSMTALVTIVLEKVAGVPTLPAAALGAKGSDGTYPVQVQDANGKLSCRKVGVGINNNVTAQILSGLQVGDKVVVGVAAIPGQPPPKVAAACAGDQAAGH